MPLTSYELKNLLLECDKQSFEVYAIGENGISFDTWNPSQTKSKFEKRVERIQKYVNKNIKSIQGVKVIGQYKIKDDYIFVHIKFS